MKDGFIDYYHLLEINIFASEEAIKAAYKRLSKKYHPDNNGDEIMFANIAEAYSILNDSILRRKYLQEWKKNKFSHNIHCHYPFDSSYDDIAFQPAREAVHEYMFYIMNQEYDQAYNMLCNDSRKRIFKRDFIKWQELVGEVHEILSFDSSFETIEFVDAKGIQVIFQVKVREQNMLLNRQEEDFFKRVIIYEEQSWRIHLHNINIRQIIKKYKQIIAIHKRKMKLLSRQCHYSFHTKYLDVDSFMQNVEYEFLRYKRYNRTYGLVSLTFKQQAFRQQQKILLLVDQNTRITDSFCLIDGQIIMILITEIDKEGLKAFKNKINQAFNTSEIVDYECCFSLVDEAIVSSKDMVNQVVLSE